MSEGTTSRTQLTFVIEGLPDDAGDVRLETFVGELQQLQRALRVSTVAVSGESGRVRYRVVDLRHDSPAAITVEGSSPKTGLPTGDVRAVFSYLMRAFISARDGVTGDIPTDLVEVIGHLADGVQHRFARIGIRWGDTEAVVDDEMARALNVVEAAETRSWGTVRGRVERYNTHGSASRFFLYPRLGDTVRCDFPPALVSEAAESVEKDVSVTGVMRYRSGRPLPYQCIVDSIEVHKADAELPELVVGSAPDIAGGATTSEYLRRLRDAWD